MKSRKSHTHTTIVSRTKAGNPSTHIEYTYDAQRGNLVEIRHNTDGDAANDVVYTFEQDALGRQTAVKVGNQTLSQSAYQNDPTKPNFGTLTATTYGNGAKISSRYDDFNRVTGVVYGEETAPRYEYDYNAKGQVARVRDNLLNRTTQSEYDLANRSVRVKTAEAGQHVYTGQVAYDNVYGNLSEFTEKVGENRQEFGTKFGYDDENRPTSLTYSMGAATIGQSTTTIDKLNRTTFSTVKLGSKTFTSEYHFAAGGYGTGSVTNLVASITQPGCNCGYGYDDNGNIASATLNGKWTGYTYDELGQLIQVDDHSDTRSGKNGATWKYTYDLGGNILKKERFAYNDTTNPLETVTYEYGDANWRDKLTAVNGSTIRYDAIGNPLNDGTWTYTWENGRQLARMQSANVDAKFVYNENGLRVQKIVNGVVTDYVLHGKNVVHMTSGADELHFFYDAQNRPAVVVYNGVPYAYVKSLQGDIVAILDENGNTVVSYGYDAWGAPLWCTGELAETLGKVQPFRYRGYVFDEETGLYYLRSRYYNAVVGRFLNEDALLNGNLYSYCNNDAINYEDPTGFIPGSFSKVSALFCMALYTDCDAASSAPECKDCVVDSSIELHEGGYYYITPINDVGYAISLKAGNESKTTGVNIYKHNTQTGAHEFYVAQYIEGEFVFVRDDYVVKGSPLAFNVTATARVEEYLFGKKVISTYHPVPSQYIRNLQYALKKAMVYFGEENGLYDEATIAAVKAFQRNANLKNVDGIVGEETKEALIPNEGP